MKGSLLQLTEHIFKEYLLKNQATIVVVIGNWVLKLLEACAEKTGCRLGPHFQNAATIYQLFKEHKTASESTQELTEADLIRLTLPEAIMSELKLK